MLPYFISCFQLLLLCRPPCDRPGNWPRDRCVRGQLSLANPSLSRHSQPLELEPGIRRVGSFVLALVPSPQRFVRQGAPTYKRDTAIYRTRTGKYIQGHSLSMAFWPNTGRHTDVFGRRFAQTAPRHGARLACLRPRKHESLKIPKKRESITHAQLFRACVFTNLLVSEVPHRVIRKELQRATKKLQFQLMRTSRNKTGEGTRKLGEHREAKLRQNKLSLADEKKGTLGTGSSQTRSVTKDLWMSL